MRIRSLHVGAYGRFRDLDLALDGEGVQMILGPNEAGKTTLLEFVRELLFGFAERTPYAFGPAANGKVEGGATLALDDGSLVAMRRRKGRKNTVSGSIDGRAGELDEEAFEALLGGASPNLFRSVFAFGLEELAAGERSLADQSVKSVLFSAGAAGAADPKRVLESLDAEARKLYTDQSKTLVVNRLLTDLADLSKQVKGKSIRCESYEQRRQELETAEAEADALGATLLEAARDLALREKLAKAHPPWRELGMLRRERAGLSAPEGFPADGLARFEAVEAEAARLAEERDKDLEGAARAERALADVRFDPRPIERRALIEELNRAIEAVKQARRDLPEDRRQRDAALREAADRVAGLAPDWTLDDLRGFQLTAERKDRFDRLVDERDARLKALDDLAARRARIVEERDEKAAELAELGDPVDVAPWSALMQEADAYKNDVQECDRRRAEHRKLQREVDDLLPRLAPPLASPTIRAAQLPAPPREAVARFKQDLQRIDGRVEAAEAALARDEAGLDALGREVAALAGRDADLPSRDVLDAMREGRDAGWDLVRRRFVDREDVEAEIREWLAEHAADAPPDLIAAFPETIRRADLYADDLFRHSSAVAKLEQLHALRDRVRHDREALDDLRADAAAVLNCWRGLWADCGLAPLAPEAMEGWLDRLEALRSLQARLAEHEQEGRLLRGRIDDFERRLGELTGHMGVPAARLLVVAREREREIREAEKARGDLRTAGRRLQEKADRLEAEAQARRADEPAWDARRAALLRELHLPEAWDVGLLGRVLQGLGETAAGLKLADACDVRIAAHETRLAAFEPRVRALVEEIAPELADAAPEQAAAELHARLTGSVQDRERQANLEKNRADALAEAARREERLGRLRCDREALLLAAGAETAAAYRAAAAQAARIAELERAMLDKSREFDRLREAEPLDAFVARLESADAPGLEAERAEAEARRDRVQAEKSAADRNVGSRRQALSEYERGGGDAAEIQEKVSARRAELAAVVDRYVPLVLAQHLLRQAIARFEQDARPEMLRETSRLFETMTGGRYVRVERPDDDESPLQVRRIDDEVLEPHQLSTGTREQLYLAVRLAYVLHYCGRAESLPIVMDDVLANFDDDRSRRTLRALGEISKKVQVLFLTCHPHTIELGREVFPLLRPLALAAAGKPGEPDPPKLEAEPEGSPRGGKGRRQRTLLDLSPSN
ncbi:AAA family ATPase [Paludisphaera mucosa]|uniref:AAA family ATPase n=1 Tax=Paludisphaera mucosa TaxID=3030827 RepID=A0ABT6FK55_9BACT|nr:AAA family ATPase [Paludisphaera mucosa]MDG3007962.1 AAA family ATPase [Paludisphaera mucosa]